MSTLPQIVATPSLPMRVSAESAYADDQWQLARDVAAALVALGYSEAQIAPLVAELMALMEAGSNPGSPVSPGNPEEFSILNLAGLVLDRVPASSFLRLHMRPVDDPARRRPDIRAPGPCSGGRRRCRPSRWCPGRCA